MLNKFLALINIMYLDSNSQLSQEEKQYHRFNSQGILKQNIIEQQKSVVKCNKALNELKSKYPLNLTEIVNTEGKRIQAVQILEYLTQLEKELFGDNLSFAFEKLTN